MTGCCATCSPAARASRRLDKEWRRGVLPPGQLGWRLAQRTWSTRPQPLAEVAETLHAGPPGRARRRRRPRRRPPAARHRHRPVRRPAGPRQLLPARTQAPPRRLGPAAGPVRQPAHPPVLRRIHRARRPRDAVETGRPHGSRGLGPVAEAHALLLDLVAIYDAGMREPMPLPLKTGHEWALKHRSPEVARTKAGGVQVEERQLPRRGRRSRAGRWSGAATPLATLLAQRPRPRRGDRGRDAPASARSPRRLWLPMIERVHGDADLIEPFDLLGELPTGTTVLEASAGTGKTYAVAALVDALRRRGHRAPRRDARDHLRPGRQPGAARAGPQPARRGRSERWPTRRRSAHDALPGLPRRGSAPPRLRPAAQAPARRAGRLRLGDDRHHPPVLPAGAALARGRRRHRPRADARGEPRRARGRGRRRPLPALRSARRAASLPFESSDRPRGSPAPRSATRRPALAPREADPTSAAAARVGFAGQVREEVERRKRRLGVLTYDDLLSRLAEALEGRRLPGPGADAPALEDRAGRRVPGHRPGAVGRCSTAPSPGTRRWC